MNLLRLLKKVLQDFGCAPLRAGWRQPYLCAKRRRGDSLCSARDTYLLTQQKGKLSLGLSGADEKYPSFWEFAPTHQRAMFRLFPRSSTIGPNYDGANVRTNGCGEQR